MPIQRSEIKQNEHNTTEKKTVVEEQALIQEVRSEPEQAQDHALRPKTLSEYIGQEKLKTILEISTKAALKRNDPASIGHILLYGAPGLGKTSCALLLAEMLGSKAHIVSAPAIDKPKDIVGILMGLNEGDILFIDEIHRLNRVSEELLYPVLEDFCLDFATGKGATAKVNRISLPKFILIGATTKLGNLSAPLRDRFIQIYHMEFYNLEELSQIIQANAHKLELSISEEGIRALATCSRGTPRIANRLLRLLRDYLHYHDYELAEIDQIKSTLELHGIDEGGLDSMDRKILISIRDDFAGGPVGLEALAATLGQDATTIEDYYEPYLLQQGLIERTPKGRRISEKGLSNLAA